MDPIINPDVPARNRSCSSVPASRLVALVVAALAAAVLAAAASRPAPPAVLIGDDRVEWDALHAPLAEAAGAAVLEDVILGKALAAELAARSISLEPDAADQERRLLAATLATAAGRPESDGPILIDQVRTARGLGPSRFQNLLERNAGLRRLARAELGPALEPTETDVEQAYALKHGPRVRLRLILVASQERAAEAVRRLDGGLGEPFASVAADLSLDPSAVRGGLLDPVSPGDPSLPVALRRARGGLSPGQTSPPIAVEWDAGAGGNVPGFAIVKVEEAIPAPSSAPAPGEAADALRAEVRLVRERAAMDRIARRLIAGARVTVFDPSLAWSWDRRPGGGGR